MQHLYFSDIVIDELGINQRILSAEGTKNISICVPSAGGRADYWCFSVKSIPNLALTSIDGNQCFPFYTYDEDGTNRSENIADWALKEFQTYYTNKKITKWDIFYYVYGLLHHPEYRDKYKANLKRELPRILFALDFWGFSKAGRKLAELHADYEKQEEYPLEMIEDKDEPLNWRVEKMKLSKDKTLLIYNSFLTLAGIPPEVFEYRLGNRSALDWIVDQYRIKTDKRSGIVNDPNREDEPDYIVKLIKKVITISLETNKIIKALPALGVE
jgi:predicted helicase